MNPMENKARDTSGAGDSYLFDHFNIKIMMGDIRFSRDAFLPGQIIPDQNVTMDSGEETSLHREKK